MSRNFPRWSRPSALSGKRKSARPGPPASASSSGGTWKTSDLPEAVGVVTSTFSPRRTAAIASAWWLQRRFTPPRARSATSGPRSRGGRVFGVASKITDAAWFAPGSIAGEHGDEGPALGGGDGPAVGRRGRRRSQEKRAQRRAGRRSQEKKL